MEEQRYNVVFAGPNNTGEEYVDILMQELRDRFHLSIEAVQKMMTLAPVTVKHELTLVDAQRYQEALEAIGASVQIEPIDRGRTETPA